MRLRWLARLLLPPMRRLAARRRPDFQVIREDEVVYLRRWWILPRNRVMNLYLHNMIGDDDAVVHDHPYWSLGLALTDGLVENYTSEPEKDCQNGLYILRTRKIEQGQLVYRSSTFAHQLLVRREAWTLFLTGPRVREWGFWCPQAWRRWQNYVAANQDPSGAGSGKSGVGRGCGEILP